MEINDTTVFKLKRSAILFYVIWGILSLVTGTVLLGMVIGTYMHISVRLFMLLIIILMLLFGYFFLYLSWKSQLIVSSLGVTYKEPFLTITCEWEHITGIVFSEKMLLLTLDESIKPRRNVIKFEGRKRESIPIYQFVKNWQEQKDWQQNALLKLIAFNMPGIDHEISQHGR